ncbi:substrate-binding domain-containing protein [Streptomyces capitiformicae]|nr:substrate-binding domain-containing protein [Streptomyces capitiformicae]
MVAEGEGGLGEVVEGDVRRQPVASGAGEAEAAFDLGYGGRGCAAEQVHRAEPDVGEGGGPGRAVVLEGVVEGGVETVLGGIEVAVGESGEAGAGAGLAADLGVVLTGGDAVGLGPVRGGGGGTTRVVGNLLSLREPPTAVFAEQDELAASVISTLRTVQIEVPQRISVLGFDDQLMAEWLDLSTVAQSPSDMGRAAAELALELINDPDADRARHIVLPTHLIPRGTTAPPPAHHSEQESSGGLSDGAGRRP